MSSDRRPLSGPHVDVRGSKAALLGSGICVCVGSGPGDPDGAGVTGMCKNQDVSPVGGSEEETGHRSGARQ